MSRLSGSVRSFRIAFVARLAPAHLRPTAFVAAGLLVTGLAGWNLGCAGAETDRSAPRASGRVAQTTSDGLELARSTKRSVPWVKPDHHLGR